jgi:hypothetical protein
VLDQMPLPQVRLPAQMGETQFKDRSDLLMSLTISLSLTTSDLQLHRFRRRFFIVQAKKQTIIPHQVHRHPPQWHPPKFHRG